MSKKSKRRSGTIEKNEATWIVGEVTLPDERVVGLNASGQNVIQNWMDGMARNDNLGLRMPVPAGHDRLRVVLYENPSHGKVQVAFMPAPNDEPPPDKLPNGDFLIATTMPVDREMAGWLGAAWLARWIEDVEELKSIIARLAPISSDDAFAKGTIH